MTASARRLILLTACLSCMLIGPHVAWAQQKFKFDQGDWQLEAELDPTTPEGRIQQIRRHIAQEHPKPALKLADTWIETYPNHPLLVEAHLLRGDAKVARRQYFKALFDYEYVISVFPASEQFRTALDREFEIARLFGAGMKRKWAGMRIMPAAEEAEELLIRIQERSPGSDVAERASITLGEFYFKRAEMSSAVIAFEMFLRNYPQSRFRERAMLRLIQTNLATFKGPNFDATGLIEASQRLKNFAVGFPVAAERIGADSLMLRIDESLALKQLYRAQWYERTGRQVSAVYVYQRVLKDHAQTVAAQAALGRLNELGKPPLPPAEDQPPAEPIEEQDARAQDQGDAPLTVGCITRSRGWLGLRSEATCPSTIRRTLQLGAARFAWRLSGARFA